LQVGYDMVLFVTGSHTLNIKGQQASLVVFAWLWEQYVCDLIKNAVQTQVCRLSNLGNFQRKYGLCLVFSWILHYLFSLSSVEVSVP